MILFEISRTKNKNTMTVEEIIIELKTMADPSKVSFKEKKFGVIATNPLGIYHKDLKQNSEKTMRTAEADRMSIPIHEALPNFLRLRLATRKLFNATG